MRIIDTSLFLQELIAANIPVASCYLPITDLNTESSQYRRSYIQYDNKYARIDWRSEPTAQQKAKATEILLKHAKTQATEPYTIIDVGSGFPVVSQKQTKQPLRMVPTSTRFVPDEVCSVLQWALTQNIRETKSSFPVSNSFVQTSNDVLNCVKKVLESQHSLEFFNNGVMFFGDSAARVQLEELAHWLLAQSLKFSPEEAVERLHQFLEIDATPVERIICIRGINVKSKVYLNEGIELVPFTQLVNFSNKQIIENPDLHSYFYFFSQVAPTAALVQATPIKPKMASDFPDELVTNLDCQSWDKLLDTLHCLTLVGPCAPITLCEYSQLPEWIPLSSKQQGISSPIHEINPNVFSLPDEALPVFDVFEARKVLKEYLRLDENIRRKLHLPIERLNLAMRRQSNVDKAIELRIALESILTADRDKDAPISFLMRLRGSLLLGGSSDERRRHYDFLRELYSLCSNAVHNGKLEHKVKRLQIPTTYAIQDGIELCAKLIKRIIEQGCFPNWDDMTLGIEQIPLDSEFITE